MSESIWSIFPWAKMTSWGSGGIVSGYFIVARALTLLT